MHPVFAVDGNVSAMGGWITIDSPTVLGVMAGAGFDYLCIDAQHSLIGVTEAARLLHCVDRSGPPVLVRLPGNDAADIGKLLDSGADGIVVPMVETAQQAGEAASACAYAPLGRRSFGPIRRDLPRDPAGLAGRASCFAMIETRAGVDNAAAIAAVPGIAGLYLGPADLAISLGLEPGDWKAPEVQRASAALVDACRSAGKIAAGHAMSASQAADMIALGISHVSLTSDKAFIASAAGAMIADMRQAMA